MVGLWPGALALLALAGIVASTFGALLAAAPEVDPAMLVTDPYLRHVVAFTFAQALLSTVLSVGLAVPAATSRSLPASKTRWSSRRFLPTSTANPR